MYMRQRLVCSLEVAILFSCTLSICGQAPNSDLSAPLPAINESIPTAFDKYPMGRDSTSQAGVPKGKVFQFEMKDSKIFPHTARTISVYVPVAYRADRPACAFVFLDGIGFNAATVFDNLIAQNAMPITIAIGVSPGTVDSVHPTENPRFDRSFEFDSMTDRLARFLLEEVLPKVQGQRTPDGLPIRLSDRADDRAIAGSSTGGIAAFNVAWQHPEAFHRVFTAIGTFVGMRGGESFYVRVRKTEPKPIRIFMEDGMNDEWAGAEMGDWWMSNLTMYRALSFAGYDVNHTWGAGTHNGTHAASIFPDAMRWMWRDWPAPITPKSPSNRVLEAVLKPEEDWQLVTNRCKPGLMLAATLRGEVIYQAAGAGGTASLKQDGSKVSCAANGDTSAFAVGPDGKRYHARSQGGIEILTPGVAKNVLFQSGKNLRLAALTVRSNGDIYATTVPRDGRNDLWLLPAQGPARKLDDDLKVARGVAVSPDGLWLFVSQNSSRFGMSYRVRADGTLDAREPFYDFDLPAGADAPEPEQIAFDSEGRPYVATRMGIQIFDRNGRVAAIMPLPGNEIATGICFGGKNFDTMFVAAGNKIFKRQMSIKGAAPWAVPTKLPPWGAG